MTHVLRDLTAEKFNRLAHEAATSAEECSRRGDLEGNWYALGLRDAYATAASFIPDDPYQEIT